MLVAFPIGLWVFSFICDLIFLFGGRSMVWGTVAFYALAGGIIGAVLAAFPGLIDYLSIVERDVNALGTKHMILNLCALLVFCISLWLRTRPESGTRLPILFSAIGIACIAASGWYGGEMVYVKGMAVSAAGDVSRRKPGSP